MYLYLIVYLYWYIGAFSVEQDKLHWCAWRPAWCVQLWVWVDESISIAVVGVVVGGVLCSNGSIGWKIGTELSFTI